MKAQRSFDGTFRRAFEEDQKQVEIKFFKTSLGRLAGHYSMLKKSLDHTEAETGQFDSA